MSATLVSAATAIDGYELTKKGRAGKALGTACIASFFGGLLSCISLYFFAPMLAQLAMKFGSPEYFWLALFGLTIIAGVTTGSMVKGLSLVPRPAAKIIPLAYTLIWA